MQRIFLIWTVVLTVMFGLASPAHANPLPPGIEELGKESDAEGPLVHIRVIKGLPDGGYTSGKRLAEHYRTNLVAIRKMNLGTTLAGCGFIPKIKVPPKADAERVYRERAAGGAWDDCADPAKQRFSLIQGEKMVIRPGKPALTIPEKLNKCEKDLASVRNDQPSDDDDDKRQIIVQNDCPAAPACPACPPAPPSGPTNAGPGTGSGPAAGPGSPGTAPQGPSGGSTVASASPDAAAIAKLQEELTKSKAANAKLTAEFGVMQKKAWTFSVWNGLLAMFFILALGVGYVFMKEHWEAKLLESVQTHGGLLSEEMAVKTRRLQEAHQTIQSELQAANRTLQSELNDREGRIGTLNARIHDLEKRNDVMAFQTLRERDHAFVSSLELVVYGESRRISGASDEEIEEGLASRMAVLLSDMWSERKDNHAAVDVLHQTVTGKAPEASDAELTIASRLDGLNATLLGLTTKLNPFVHDRGNDEMIPSGFTAAVDAIVIELESAHSVRSLEPVAIPNAEALLREELGVARSEEERMRGELLTLKNKFDRLQEQFDSIQAAEAAAQKMYEVDPPGLGQDTGVREMASATKTLVPQQTRHHTPMGLGALSETLNEREQAAWVGLGTFSDVFRPDSSKTTEIRLEHDWQIELMKRVAILGTRVKYCCYNREDKSSQSFTAVQLLELPAEYAQHLRGFADKDRESAAARAN